MADEDAGQEQKGGRGDAVPGSESEKAGDAEEDARKPREHESKVNPKRDPVRFPEVVIAFASLAGVVVAGAYTYVASQQWKAMEAANAATEKMIALTDKMLKVSTDALAEARQQARFVERSSRNSARPYIVSEGIDQIDLDKVPPLVISVTLHNVGHGPAHKARVLIAASCEYGSEPLPRKLNYEDGARVASSATGEMLMGPGQTRHASITINNVDWIEFARRGGKLLCIYGFSLYQDAFGTLHTTEFCSVFERDTKGWRLCTTHNGDVRD